MTSVFPHEQTFSGAVFMWRHRSGLMQGAQSQFCQLLRFTASYARRLNSTTNGWPISRCAMIKPAVFFLGEIHHWVPARPPQKSSPLASWWSNTEGSRINAPASPCPLPWSSPKAANRSQKGRDSTKRRTIRGLTEKGRQKLSLAAKERWAAAKRKGMTTLASWMVSQGMRCSISFGRLTPDKSPSMTASELGYRRSAGA